VSTPPQPPKYIRTTIRNGTDDDPGEIREGLYSVEAGVLVLTDLLGDVLASQVLRQGQDPSEIARKLLREGTGDSSFNAPLRYGPLSVA
jgi:hypothetical protein